MTWGKKHYNASAQSATLDGATTLAPQVQVRRPRKHYNDFG